LVQEEGLALRPVERLPDDLVNKIAAGEVVERPASVVKELVENALDAGARQIRVEVEAGGKSLIRVTDDGHGMSRADTDLCAERHATSKLRVFADLHSLSTSGFRGEALPSIASVSLFVLKTREEGSAAGTEVEIEHGRRLHLREVGHPRGTTVEARDLFGEVPARRKFLRADSTEMGHVAEAVSLLAVAHPERGFWLKSGGRTLIEAPPVEALGPRLYQLFGGRLLDGLVEVDGGEDWARVSGLVSRPDGARTGRPNLRLLVNGRPVRDRALAKGVAEAYRRAGAGERGFEAFLRLEVPAHLVDVNVHPAKSEVRFADPRTVWTAVERAMSDALAGGVRRAPPALSRLAAAAPAALDTFLDRPKVPSEPQSRGLVYGLEPDGGPAWVAETSTVEAPRVPTDPAPELRVLGQHRNTYIVATDGEELVLVDQHTAHERVRFEQLLSRVERRAAESQLLLAPVVWVLAPELLPLLEAHAEALVNLGYDVEAFGGGSARVRAVPALLGPREPGEALERLLHDVRDREGKEWAVAEVKDRLAATLACHSAVRAGQALSVESMSGIARDLLKTRHPTLCPHGRPTMVRLPKEDVSRWFGRVGWGRR
jgi:DNA mismatch repair protein MutL